MIVKNNISWFVMKQVVTSFDLVVFHDFIMEVFTNVIVASKIFPLCEYITGPKDMED